MHHLWTAVSPLQLHDVTIFVADVRFATQLYLQDSWRCEGTRGHLCFPAAKQVVTLELIVPWTGRRLTKTSVWKVYWGQCEVKDNFITIYT